MKRAVMYQFMIAVSVMKQCDLVFQDMNRSDQLLPRITKAILLEPQRLGSADQAAEAEKNSRFYRLLEKSWIRKLSCKA